MRRRFFVERFDGVSATLSGEAAHHLGRVLRAEPGQVYELSDGEAVWLGRVERVRKDAVEFALVEQLPAQQPKLHVTLALSIVKFDRFEWSLEKATELGVSEIVPLAAARSEKSLVAAAGKRAARWQRILLESAQQSRRLRLPSLKDAARPREFFGSLSTMSSAACKTESKGGEGACRVLLSEKPDAASLKRVLAGRVASACVLAVGPEGGWTEEEFGAAGDAGFEEASLGANILRTETAVVAALAAINFALAE
jgi:16S rRNA (uracil1498-N3)-methyltransferase